MIMSDPKPVLAYIGPDVLLPVASALAAIAGFFLMAGRRAIAFFKDIGRRIAGLFGRR